MRRLPSLRALQAFEAAARLGGFVPAAAELHVTPGAVSQQVKALEEQLGTALFVRRPRSLALTEAGRRFLPVLSDAFDAMAAAAGRLATPAPASTLTLALPARFAVGWLLPRLEHWRRAMPEIDLRLATSVGDAPELAGTDAALRLGRGGWGGDGCCFLFAEALVALCGPAQAAALRAGGGLAAATLLVADARAGLWEAWSEAVRPGQPLPESRRRFSDESLLVQAAQNGLGVALADRHLVQRQLDRAELVEPLGLPPWRPGTAWHLAWPRGRPPDGPLRSLLDWLLGQAEVPEA